MNGMAEVIAAHHGYQFEFEVKDVEDAVSCDCGQPMVLSDHSAHVAEELAKAGYGKLPEPEKDKWAEFDKWLEEA